MDNFVSRGMVVDFAVHQPDKEDGGISNPHFHVMCPIRPIEPDGRWGNKQRREYVLDEHGERIRDEAGNYVFNAVPTTDWGKPETLGRIGGRRGLICAIRSLRRKVWIAGSTTAAMNDKALNRFLPSTRDRLSAR